MEVQKTPSGAERALFAFTRFLSLGGSLLALLGIAAALILVFPSLRAGTTHVSLSDVLARPSVGTTKASDADGSAPAPNIQMPEKVKKYLGNEENKKVLDGWLQRLDAEQRVDFLNNLSEVIGAAEASGVTDMAAPINGYKELKFAKLNAPAFDKYAKQAARGAFLSFVVAMVLLLALFSLVLVLLAIERNTRTATASQVDDAEGRRLEPRWTSENLPLVDGSKPAMVGTVGTALA